MGSRCVPPTAQRSALRLWSLKLPHWEGWQGLRSSSRGRWLTLHCQAMGRSHWSWHRAYFSSFSHAIALLGPFVCPPLGLKA